jgi:hypothetical protein
MITVDTTDKFGQMVLVIDIICMEARNVICITFRLGAILRILAFIHLYVFTSVVV